jgi:2-polyprenyl-6-hydroxyphenyl methylase/3-demethylubiquinone-9 3-methyltransferase
MDRLRYHESHWSREGDASKALEQYLHLASLPFNRVKARLMDRLLGNVAGRTILDYGGGAGIMSIPFAKRGAMVSLVDAEEGALRTAKLYAEKEGITGNVSLICSGGISEELRAKKFDIIVAKDVIEHIENDEEFLRNLSQTQTPGGMLLVSTQNSFSINYLVEGLYQKVWCGNSRWCGWDQTHLRFYTPRSLKNKLLGAGYQPEAWASVFIVPYNILSWCVLLKRQIQLPQLQYIDLMLGDLPPFNRVGWNIIVKARKTH